MSVSTKQKILDAAIRLFNENGLCNVRLQQIADETGISVGNLAYHFKNKEAIVNQAYEMLFVEFSEILTAYLRYPDLRDMDNQLELYFAFFKKYQFYLTDLFEVERSFPGIIAQWHQCVQKMLAQIRKRIDFNMQRAILAPETHPGSYDLLANNIWMTITFWIPQRILRGLPIDEASFREAVWSQLLPWFTYKGREEYQQLIQPSIMAIRNGERK
ncbi:MAG TPA: TetR/AcrR family transcriptional regulator [Saprospiraceae bacterium]|nr:TetR/AcrR family transcriptional regulator [Saprospiraceae bacterium]HMP23969.1 TetR/AcrR family transcriptional regulator [Saprospiraceae bacterium]